MLDLPFNRALTIASLGLMVIGGAFASGVWDLPGSWVSPDTAVLVTLCGVILSTCGLLSLCLFCRCEQCWFRLFWHAAHDRQDPGALRWCISANQCPRCGARGD